MPKRPGATDRSKPGKTRGRARKAGRAMPPSPSAADFKRILSNIGEITYEVATPGDPMAGKTVYVSPQVEALVGSPPEEFLRDPTLWFHLLHPDDVEAVVQATREMYQSRQPATRHYRLRHRSTGHYRWMEDRVVPRLNRKGQVAGYFGAARDVTDQVVAKELLRESEERLRTVLNNAPITIFALDQHGVFTLSEGKGLERVGLRPGENVGVSALDLYDALPVVQPNGTAITGRDAVHRVLAGETVTGITRLKDDYFDNQMVPHRDDHGRVIGMVGVATIVTERERAVQALRESEDRYRTLFETSADAVYVSTRSGALLEVNPAAQELWGGTREELLRLDVRELYHDPGDRERFQEEIERTGTVRNYEVRFRRRDGGVRDCLLAATARHASDGTVTGYQGIIHDITERKRAEQLVRASRDRLRSLAAELHSVREQERTAVAREIHDELGQMLTGLKMDLTWLLEGFGDRAAARERIGGMLELADRGIEAVRSLAARLRPAVLDDIGLVAALEWLAADFAKHSGVACECEVPAEEPVLSPECATAVFRIAQEAFTNVTRHAGASRAWLRFTCGDAITLQVRDNGAGITEEQVSNVHSIGVIGMRERAGALGGHVDIQPGAERGTVVILRIPLSPPGTPAPAP